MNLPSPKSRRPSVDLDGLLRQVRACRLCMDAPFARPLPHDPRPVVRLSGSARLLIAGQAPGTKVHATGLPFNDASGKRLRAWMGVDAATFYDESRIAFLPMGFCFPGQDASGGDLPPRRNAHLTGGRRWWMHCRMSSLCWRSVAMLNSGI